MFSIAICDDDKLIRNQVVTQIRSTFSYMRDSLKIDVFNNGTSLLNRVNEGAFYDMAILDIEMPKLSGMQLSVKLKEIFGDILIVYLTAHEQYVYESFRTQPFRFIPKNRMSPMLNQAIREAIVMVEMDADKTYLLKSNQEIERIPYRDIVYIQKEGKYVRFVRRSGRITKERKTLKEVMDLIDSDMFIWIDRSCVCNLNYVQHVKEGSVIMQDDIELQASKERAQDILDAMLDYYIKIGR